MEDTPVAAPANMGEMNVTMSYVRRDLANLNRKFDTMDAKLDTITQNAVTQSEFISYKIHVDKTFATKEELLPITRIMWGIGAIIGSSIILGLIELLVKKQ